MQPLTEKDLLEAGWDKDGGTPPKFTNTVPFTFKENGKMNSAAAGVTRRLAEALELESKRPVPVLDKDGHPVMERGSVKLVPRRFDPPAPAPAPEQHN